MRIKHIFVIVFCIACTSFLSVNIFATEKESVILPLSDLIIIQSDTFKEIVITDENKTFVKNVLLDAIEVAVNSVANAKSSTDESERGFKAGYIYLGDNYNIELKHFDKVKYIYDPLHPNAIASGKNKGYVIYPDVDIERLENEIIFILHFLKENDL